jgi:hypothetical protein
MKYQRRRTEHASHGLAGIILACLALAALVGGCTRSYMQSMPDFRIESLIPWFIIASIGGEGVLRSADSRVVPKGGAASVAPSMPA